MLAQKANTFYISISSSNYSYVELSTFLCKIATSKLKPAASWHAFRFQAKWLIFITVANKCKELTMAKKPVTKKEKTLTKKNGEFRFFFTPYLWVRSSKKASIDKKMAYNKFQKHK